MLSDKMVAEVDFDTLMGSYESFQPMLVGKDVYTKQETFNAFVISHKFLLQRHFARLLQAKLIEIVDAEEPAHTDSIQGT